MSRIGRRRVTASRRRFGVRARPGLHWASLGEGAESEDRAVIDLVEPGRGSLMDLD